MCQNRTIRCHEQSAILDPKKLLRVCYLTQLSDLLAQTTDTGKGDRAWILHAHAVHHRVDFPGKHAHDCEGGHIQSHTGSQLQL